MLFLQAPLRAADVREPPIALPKFPAKVTEAASCATLRDAANALTKSATDKEAALNARGAKEVNDTMVAVAQGKAKMDVTQN